MRVLTFSVALLIALPMAACTLSQKEASAREWQRSECNKVVDREDRERCLKRVE